MIDVKALCALCGPQMYFETARYRYYASGEWVECLDLTEALDLAMAGVTLKTSTGLTISPRATILVNGTGVCGLCARGIGADKIKRQIIGQPNGTAPVPW